MLLSFYFFIRDEIDEDKRVLWYLLSTTCQC